MKLGLGSYAYRWSIGIKDQQPAKPLTPFDLVDRAADLGLEVVQYADNMPLDRLSGAEHDALREKAHARGLALELGTQSFDAEEVTRYLAIGRRIDAKIMRVALDAADARIPVATFAEQLRPLVSRASDAGIRIAIENHFNYPSPRMVQLLDTVDDLSLGVCLDVANSICAGEWPKETIAQLAPYAINLHLKDYVITPDPYGVGFHIHGVPLGEGRADIPWILEQISPATADFSVILEHWLPKGDDIGAARAAEQPWIEKTVGSARRFVQNHTAGTRNMP